MVLQSLMRVEYAMTMHPIIALQIVQASGVEAQPSTIAGLATPTSITIALKTAQVPGAEQQPKTIAEFVIPTLPMTAPKTAQEPGAETQPKTA